ncbi:MAG: hypothetical protein KDK05_22975, partial [Candidatus Competibacteraceae bacterium]|nr:hypothetical protein [Candidatus Competibacteraceae bacterium]
HAMMRLVDVADEIEMIANAFGDTGNPIMFDRLTQMAANMRLSVDDASSAVSKHIDDEYNKGRAEHGAILSALIEKVQP